MSKLDALEGLARRQADGLLSETEFEREKAAILAGVSPSPPKSSAVVSTVRRRHLVMALALLALVTTSPRVDRSLQAIRAARRRPARLN